LTIPKEKIWQAHLQAKRRLLDRIKSVTGQDWDERRMTIGFARRATGYKRAQLLFKDIQRLRQIAQKAGGFQLVYAGKAHPHDEEGKAIIREVIEAGRQLGPEIPFVYLEDYDMELGALLVAGSDVWLNTPQPPLEASGTSGMKAALNGVPSLSVLDGWWIEGHQEGITGWSIGEPPSSDPSQDRMVADSNSLYEKLEGVVLPLFYTNQDGFVQVMRQAIALNGSFFHTHRMLGEYVLQAYFA
jgi:starch phosphorylase